MTSPPTSSGPVLGLSSEDMQKISEILGRLAESKLPLPEILIKISEDLPQKSLRQALEQIGRNVGEGKSLEESLEILQDSSNMVAIGTIRSVLKTHTPAKTLFQVLKHQQMRKDLERGFWLKLVYPMILLLACSLLFGAVLRVISTQFIPIFRDFGISLPVLTQIVVSFADSASKLGWFGILVPLVFSSFIVAAISVAINGSLRKWLDMAQFCRISADLMDSQCPLHETLAISRMLSTGRLGAALDDMMELVQQGLSLPESIELQRAFPDGVADLIRWSSDHGGSGAEGLRVAASLYESRGRSQSRFLASVFTVFTACVVVWMIMITMIAIFAPMLSLLGMLSG